jgi:hypothetical protein
MRQLQLLLQITNVVNMSLFTAQVYPWEALGFLGKLSPVFADPADH